MTPGAKKPEPEVLFLGLDLGKVQDFSALVALAQRPLPVAPDASPETTPAYRYTLRGLKRWRLGTLYREIVAEVVELVSKPPLAGCTLGVDWTGSGGPVVESLQDAMPDAVIRPILITAGFTVRPDGLGYHVPKQELVAVLQMLLQSRRLEIPDTIPKRQARQRELQAFRARVTAKGNETFEADWRSRQKDDLVLAIAIAAWLGERSGCVGPVTGFSRPPRTAEERLAEGSAAARRGLYRLRRWR
jgi:hypothetical protein